MLICQNKMKTQSRMCIAEKKGYVLPPSSPAAAEALQLLAVVQALERTSGCKIPATLLKAACPWGHFLLLPQLPLKKKWRITVFPVS